MSKIIDFRCSYDNSAGISQEILKETELKFPDAYKTWEGITQLALAQKKHDQVNFCQLPFCHTVEGEALGASINYGDEVNGPRGKDYICTRVEELLDLPEIDYSTGRIAEVLKACQNLRGMGENVMLYISGPFTILNLLIEPRFIFKGFKKNPQLMMELFQQIKNEILRFVLEAQKAGVNLISYGDSVGGLNILGPKLLEEVTEGFTYPLLKDMEVLLNPESIVLLCPKTSLALLGIDKAQWREITLEKNMNYTEACIKVTGQAKFVGQMCIKNKDFRLENGNLKVIDLL